MLEQMEDEAEQLECFARFCQKLPGGASVLLPGQKKRVRHKQFGVCEFVDSRKIFSDEEEEDENSQVGEQIIQDQPEKKGEEGRKVR